MQAPLVDTGATPGGWLAVSNDTSGATSQIYLVRPDGSGAVQLTHREQARSPAWSPDGAWIAFTRLGDSAVRGVWIVRPDGSGETRLANDGHGALWIDRGRVGYSCPAGLCAVGIDGSRPATLLASAAPEGSYDVDYSLSPDGRTLAFVRYSTDDFLSGTGTIYLANLDGSGGRKLTTTVERRDDETFPRWSRDGTQIAFWSGGLGLTVVDADGGRLHRVTQQETLRGLSAIIGAGAPAWSPDGTRLVFGWNGKLFYIANADGTGSIRLVRSTLPETLFFPTGEWSWSPR